VEPRIFSAYPPAASLALRTKRRHAMGRFARRKRPGSGRTTFTASVDKADRHSESDLNASPPMDVADIHAILDSTVRPGSYASRVVTKQGVSDVSLSGAEDPRAAGTVKVKVNSP